jgi:hypothetical protein
MAGKIESRSVGDGRALIMGIQQIDQPKRDPLAEVCPWLAIPKDITDSGSMQNVFRYQAIQNYKVIRQHLGKLGLRMRRCGLEEEALDMLPCMFQLLTASVTLADHRANKRYYTLIEQFDDEVARREQEAGLDGVPVDGETSLDIIGDLEPRLAFEDTGYRKPNGDIDAKAFHSHLMALKERCADCMRERVAKLVVELNELGLSGWAQARVGPLVDLVNQIFLRLN